MARQEIRQYSPDEIKEMVTRGNTLTSPDAPEIELGEDFWRNARVVMPDEKGKTSISLRVDTKVLEWFKKQGRGHLTRMNAVLRAYVAAQKEQR